MWSMSGRVRVIHTKAAVFCAHVWNMYYLILLEIREEYHLF